MDSPSERRLFTRRFSYVERCMERARDERFAVCAAAMSAAFRKVRRALTPSSLEALAASGRPRQSAFAPKPRKAVTAMLVAGAAAFSIAAAAFPVPGHAQELTANTERRTMDSDVAALAALGLDAASIETSDNLERLWRAVRELVLPGRVSEETQRRILRRVWMIDPDIANGSRVASDTN